MSVWSYRLGSSSLFTRTNEGSTEPKRVVFLSVEGTKTEVQYLHFIEKYRVELKINALVHIEVLKRFDTKSDPENVLELLEEYIQFRENKMFENNIDSLCLKDYSTEFIKSYLEDDSCLTKKERRKFEAALREEQLDLLYLDFLGKYKGKDDAFGIVIDRDCGSHTAEQMKKVVEKCKQKEYLYYITNPCIEFCQLLHVSDVTSEYAEDLENILQNKTDENKNTFVSNLLYTKTGERKAIQVKSFEKYYLPNVDLAIKRAQGFASRDELLEKLGSNLGELIEFLRKN